MNPSKLVEFWKISCWTQSEILLPEIIGRMTSKCHFSFQKKKKLPSAKATITCSFVASVPLCKGFTLQSRWLYPIKRGCPLWLTSKLDGPGHKKSNCGQGQNWPRHGEIRPHNWTLHSWIDEYYITQIGTALSLSKIFLVFSYIQLLALKSEHCFMINDGFIFWHMGSHPLLPRSLSL